MSKKTKNMNKNKLIMKTFIVAVLLIVVPVILYLAGKSVLDLIKYLLEFIKDFLK